MSLDSTGSTLEIVRENDWVTIRLNRPESRNALNEAMTGELLAQLDAIEPDRSIRGITFRGNGAVFCAGGDIKSFKAIFQGEAGSAAEVAAANRQAGEMFARINALPQVVIMLVHGAAIAGGMGMACAGDVVIVTRDAQFALTETMLGIPPAQIAPFVVRRVGLPVARRLMLTGARFDGQAALDMGLASSLIENRSDLDHAEMEVRAAVCRCAPGAIAATKAILLASDHLEGDELRRFAADRFAECMLGDEGLEGVAAFMEKRKPHWQSPPDDIG